MNNKGNSRKYFIIGLVVAIVVVVIVIVVLLTKSFSTPSTPEAIGRAPDYIPEEVDSFSYEDPMLVASVTSLEEIGSQDTLDRQLAYAWAWHKYYQNTKIPEAGDRAVQELQKAYDLLESGDTAVSLNCYLMYDFVMDETLSEDVYTIARKLCFNGTYDVSYDDSEYATYKTRLDRGQSDIADRGTSFWLYNPESVTDEFNLSYAEKYFNFATSGVFGGTPNVDAATAAQKFKTYVLTAIDLRSLVFEVAEQLYAEDSVRAELADFDYVYLMKELVSWYSAYGKSNFDAESLCLFRTAALDFLNSEHGVSEYEYPDLVAQLMTQLPTCTNPPTGLSALIAAGHRGLIIDAKIDILDKLDAIGSRSTAAIYTDPYEAIIAAGVLSQ